MSHFRGFVCPGHRFATLLLAGLVLAGGSAWAQEGSDPAVPRQWMEELLSAISKDRPRPAVHARNLHHLSAAMWDAWVAYGSTGTAFIHHETAEAEDTDAARAEAISFAAYRLLVHRFQGSPTGAATILNDLAGRMDALGYDRFFDDTEGDSPAALGNRVAASVIAYGLDDGSNEADHYKSVFYEPINPPLDPLVNGNLNMDNPDHWQPLDLEIWCDQVGNCMSPEEPIPFETPEWGFVKPFSLTEADRDIYPDANDESWEWWVYLDPGPPALIADGDQVYQQAFADVVRFSSYLDPDDGSDPIDISPASIGNNTPGTNDGVGYDENPVTGQPYQPQMVPRGDYTRVLAEFWADGPASETPPGHWFSILHYVSDHSEPEFEMRFAGEGEVLDGMEWYVKAYLALGGAVHDAAIAAWSVKGYYDYVRPISAIRYMADLGQSTDPGDVDTYHPQGLPLEPGLIEVITEVSSGPGERHEHLEDHVGEIAIRAWAGHVGDEDPEHEYAGVDWILAGDWWPYQMPQFVTPPFAGYVSGHSTFSRAAAETMERITGSKYFPGGLGEFPIAENEFLEFEQGPSQGLTLQWASYADAADECSLSRIYGGIHPWVDDIPGRLMGYQIGPRAFARAQQLIGGDRIFDDRFSD